MEMQSCNIKNKELVDGDKPHLRGMFGRTACYAQGQVDHSLPCGSQGQAGSTAQHEPHWDHLPSPVCTTEQESGKGPADIS